LKIIKIYKKIKKDQYSLIDHQVIINFYLLEYFEIILNSLRIGRKPDLENEDQKNILKNEIKYFGLTHYFEDVLKIDL
jgi:hypothetical protein